MIASRSFRIDFRSYPKLPILFGYFRTIPHSVGCSCPNFSIYPMLPDIYIYMYFSASERNTAGHETRSTRETSDNNFPSPVPSLASHTYLYV